MNAARKSEVCCLQYELQVSIAAPAAKVWSALTSETNAWWLPDFHMVDPQSAISWDLRGGGGLREESTDGGSLLWYTTQWIRPTERTVFLVGHVAADWGGPATSQLKLAVTGSGNTSVLTVSDALTGAVTDATAVSLHDGWTQLFTAGLKEFVERPA